MRIVHFTSSFLPVYGGTTTRLSNLLADPINQHYLYIPQLPRSYFPENIGTINDQDVYGNITVHRCKLLDSSKYKNPVIKTLISLGINPSRLTKSVIEKDFNIVHGHNPISYALASMNYARDHHLPFLYEAHDVIADNISLQKGWKVLQHLNQFPLNPLVFMEKKIFTRADALITQTHAMKQRITTVYKLKDKEIAIVPNGINVDEFDPKIWNAKGSEIRKKMNWSDKIVFMYSGYLDHINGIDFFLNAVQDLPASTTRKMKIILLGRGPLQDFVESMSKKECDLIDYRGLVPYSEMPVYYNACDVFVIPRPSTLPSETLMPVKLLEAMSMEKIVLGSNVGGMIEVLKDNVNSVVFQKENKEDFLKKIAFIVEQSTAMKSMGRQARQDVAREYSWEKSRKKLQEVYTALQT